MFFIVILGHLFLKTFVHHVLKLFVQQRKCNYKLSTTVCLNSLFLIPEQPVHFNHCHKPIAIAYHARPSSFLMYKMSPAVVIIELQ